MYHQRHVQSNHLPKRLALLTAPLPMYNSRLTQKCRVHARLLKLLLANLAHLHRKLKHLARRTKRTVLHLRLRIQILLERYCLVIECPSSRMWPKGCST